MLHVSFVLDVGKLTPWDREDLTVAIMKQARDQGVQCDAEIRAGELSVALEGNEAGKLYAFEAAVKCWVTQHA